jgi:deoxycytidylate deaminase
MAILHDQRPRKLRCTPRLALQREAPVCHDRSAPLLSIATGTNEVPKAVGGVYGAGFDHEEGDHRCAYGNGYCSNTINQNQIAEELLREIFGDDKRLEDISFRTETVKRLRDGRVGDLLEFSRAVHAEMDALLSAGRKGVTTVGARLFVTTFLATIAHDTLSQQALMKCNSLNLIRRAKR